jgi:hypothetical protein
MKKYSIVAIFLLVIICGCNKNKAIEKIDNNTTVNNPKITYIKISDISQEANFCYNIDDFYHYLSNVNNNGTIVGTISVKLDNSDTCKHMSYYLALNQNHASMINYVPNPFSEQQLYENQIISSISTNNISVGHTTLFNDDGSPFHDLANYNNQKEPTSIDSYNYMYHISENGQYATIGTLIGNWGMIDIKNSKLIDTDFYLNGVNMNNDRGMLIQVNNSGTSVGFIEDQTQKRHGLLCSVSDMNCKFTVFKDNLKNSDSYLTTISENNAWAYGFINDQIVTHVFYIKNIEYKNQLAPVIINKLENFIVSGIENTTNQGLVIVTNTQDQTESLYLPSTDQIYSIPTIANMIKLDLNPQNTILGNIHISPNGKYMLLETIGTTFENKIIATVIYFPQGIENFLEHY